MTKPPRSSRETKKNQQTVIFMQRLYHPPNLFAMSAAELRTDLLQQIEQADEKLLRIVSSVLEAVKTEYAEQEAVELTDAEINALPAPPWAKKQTVAERNQQLMEADAACDRGEFVTLEALQEEAA